MAKKPLRRVLLILLATGGLLVVALLIAQDQETIRPRSAVSVEDARFPSYLAGLVGAELTHGNRFEVLTNGDQIYPPMLAAIEGAQRRISLETYIFEEGRVADQFAQALERAARRGVRVQLTVDSFGAGSMDDATIERLRAAGCAIVTSNTPRWFSLEDINYRNHRKILVVDGAVGFTGGAGVADHWLGQAQDAEHWRDTQFRVTGPVTRLLEAGFYDNFIEGGVPVAPQLDAPIQSPDEGSPSLVVTGAPAGGSNELKRLYLLVMAGARRTLDISTPYFMTDESTTWVLEEAVRRGVKVRLLVEGDKTDAMPVKYASRQIYDRLLQLGVETYEYQPTMMHAKALVVDGMLSMFGSANFDNRSLELNDELNVVVFDRGLAARLTQDLEADLRRSTKIELTRWRRRPLLEKTREHFWSYFGEVF